MKLYLVTATIATHAEVEIEADNYLDAQRKAGALKVGDFDQFPGNSVAPCIDSIYPIAEAEDEME